MAICVRCKNKNMFDISDFVSKLLVSEMGEFFLSLTAFINFVGNNLKVTGLEENQINMKRLEEMGRSTNIKNINECQGK